MRSLVCPDETPFSEAVLGGIAGRVVRPVVQEGVAAIKVRGSR